MPDPDTSSDMSAHPFVVSERVCVSIGRIILAGAEIDHLISLALFKAAGMTEENGFILFGRTTVGTKMSKLRYFVETSYKSGPTLEEFIQIEDLLQKFLHTRNMVAHGVLMGMVEDKMIFNLTTEYGDVEEMPASKAFGVTAAGLSSIAQGGTSIVGLIQTLFDVYPSHETGQYIVVRGQLPSRKSQRKKNASKSQTPPRSSQA